jgi:hypothetical protein
MKKFFYNVWRFLKEKFALTQVFFQLKMDGLRLQFAIYMANALQKARNKRFYVIENAQGKLIWLCNDDIKEMKKPKKVRKLINGKLRTFKFWMLDPKTTHQDIMRDCLYYTAESLNNKNGITVEERNKKAKKWITYMEKVRMDRIFGKYKLK